MSTLATATPADGAAARPGRGRALAGWLRQRVGALVVFAVLFLLWEFAVHLFGIKEYLLPPPSKVWTEFLKRYTVVMQHVGDAAGNHRGLPARGRRQRADG